MVHGDQARCGKPWFILAKARSEFAVKFPNFPGVPWRCPAREPGTGLRVGMQLSSSRDGAATPSCTCESSCRSLGLDMGWWES